MAAIDLALWKRRLVEGVAIVVSILLAFAIDAWWDRRAATVQAIAILQGLQADFRDSQAHLEQWLAGNRKIQSNTAVFLARVRSAHRNDLITVTEAMIGAPIGAPTYDPTTATLDAALSSGQIELIENRELREALSVWRQLMADTREDEFLIREIVVHQLVPILSSQVRLGDAFEQINGWFLDQYDAPLDKEIQVQAVSELEGVLAQRQFYQHYVVDGQAKIYDIQARILELLDTALDET